MSGYTKVFDSMLDSTVWREDDKVRLVWVTMLMMVDRDGVVSASIPGLADRARVTVEDCERALSVLSSPDPYSRSPDCEGRRIETVDGGWRLVNYARYRQKFDAQERRDYKRQHEQARRERQRAAATTRKWLRK